MIADDSRVEQKFILMYNAIWGASQGAQIDEKGKIQLPENLTRQAGTAKMFSPVPVRLFLRDCRKRPVS